MVSLSEFAARLRAVLREAARYPVMLFVVVLSAVLAWLGIWWVVRLGQLVFERFLKEPWV